MKVFQQSSNKDEKNTTAYTDLMAPSSASISAPYCHKTDTIAKYKEKKL